jgi:hypothetical protein
VLGVGVGTLYRIAPGVLKFGKRVLERFVNIEPDILPVATHFESPPWGKDHF